MSLEAVAGEHAWRPERAAGARRGVQVVDRAVAILDCFDTEHPELGIGELSRRTGITKGTIHRILASLMQHRIVEQNSVTKRYGLGIKLFELGNRATATLSYGERAHQHLRALAHETGDTVHFAVLDQGQTFYVAKVEGWHSLHMPSQVGRRLPVHCTGVGKALIAHLSEEEIEAIVATHGLPAFTERTITSLPDLMKELAKVRRQGYSRDSGEIEEGLACVAAPIRDYTGKVVAATSISGPTTRINSKTASALSVRVSETAREISAALGLAPDEPERRAQARR